LELLKIDMAFDPFHLKNSAAVFREAVVCFCRHAWFFQLGDNLKSTIDWRYQPETTAL